MRKYFMNKVAKKLSGTFVLNKDQPIHRWYPYTEGFSFQFVQHELDNLDIEVNSIYDPFGGCGTTPLVASENGITSYFSEVNPFMAFVCDTKINVSRRVYQKFEIVEEQINKLLSAFNDSFLFNENVQKLENNYNDIFNSPIVEFDGFEKYFHDDVLRKILYIQNLIEVYCKDSDSKSLSELALASIAVFVSKMIRRGDLRYATEKEKKPEDFDVYRQFTCKINEILEDIKIVGGNLKSDALLASYDAREINMEDKVDVVITSPPYLNGTNYIRNTKIELKLTKFIKTESDLPMFHTKGIMAGINNVSKRRKIPSNQIPDYIRKYVEKLEPISYDKRIPQMVAGYFYDMGIVIERLSKVLRKGGKFILDIGDSQFAGVHIPTHELLERLAWERGFHIYDNEILRSRKSKNGMVLTQRVLRFCLR